MDERMRNHLKYVERELPRDPSKRVEAPELTEEDERILTDAWAALGEDHERREPPDAA